MLDDQPIHEISLFPFQEEVIQDNSRFKLVDAGRRTGKGYLACTTALHHCLEKENNKVIFVGPTLGMCKEANWNTLKSMIHPSWIQKISESESYIKFINNSQISMKGSDRPETLRGISPSPTYIIIDEAAYMKKGTFDEVLMPMAVDPNRKAKFLLISTPNGVGGEFHKLWLRGQDPNFPDWRSWQFTCVDARPDMKEEVERARSTLDPKTFNQEYCAMFENSGDAVFYQFNYADHVTGDLPWFEPNEIVHIAVDFNVSVMAAAVFAVRGSQIHWLKDYEGSANTEELCKQINREFPNRKIRAYPDPSGKARKSSATVGVTDFTIMRNNGWDVLAFNAAPPIIDSVNCVNRMLMDANGNINMFFHNRCQKLIHSMSSTQWKDGDNANIDKTIGAEHHSDGVRYATAYLFPIKSSTRTVVRGSRF